MSLFGNVENKFTGEWFLPNNEEAKLIIAAQSKRLKAEVVSGCYWKSSVMVDSSVDFIDTQYRGGIFNADSVGYTMFSVL